jgi:hypothetical protein
MTNSAAVAAVSGKIQAPGRRSKRNAQIAERTAKSRSSPLKAGLSTARIATKKERVTKKPSNQDYPQHVSVYLENERLLH